MSSPGPEFGTRRQRVLDVLVDVVDGLTSRPARTFLLVLVFAVATGGFVAALGISQSAAYQVGRQLTPSDLDEVRLSARPPAVLPPGAEALVRDIPAVVGAGLEWRVSDAPATVAVLPAIPGRARSTVAAPVVAVSPGWLAVVSASTRPAAAGQVLGGTGRTHVALVGERLAARLGLPPPGPGVVIRVNGIPYDVVGTVGPAVRAADVDGSVLIGVSGVPRLGVPPQSPLSLVLRTRPAAAHAVAAVVPLAIAPDRPASIDVRPVLDLAELRRGVSTSLDRTVALVSGLLLALAALAIANAMVVSVMARQGEIGLRRALGASAGTVAAMFLMEGAVTGFAGGVLGTALGTAAVLVVVALQEWTAVLSVQLLPLAPALGAVVGVCAALYPARRAAAVPPAVAVRHT
ncbi:MAG TPA: FtsX-like permease family protein [Kineosporiaceae bacterium]|jgi:hypothetical protein|nr:FtsX-like permease family protein [Kineosporiaceae bacterium]